QQGFRRPVPWKHLFLFFIVLGTFIAAMLLYNQARFGSPLDFGYNTMKVNPFVRGNLHTYGQFNWHFISTNFRYMLLEPPYIVSHAPYLTFNPLGTGIFWTTPALLLAFLAFRYRSISGVWWCLPFFILEGSYHLRGHSYDCICCYNSSVV